VNSDKKIVALMIALGAAARVVPHPWNFTPMIALGLYAGAKASKWYTGAAITLLALALSDAVLGFSRDALFVYPAFLIPVLLGRWVRRSEGVGTIAAGALASSLSFFLISNGGVWAMGTLYPHTLAGLTTCLAAGVPFYRNQLLGDAVYAVALFGGHYLLTRLSRPALAPAHQ
jgi:hypothetical protein